MIGKQGEQKEIVEGNYGEEEAEAAAAARVRVVVYLLG